jgi:DNA-binding NtrC family response regulator
MTPADIVRVDDLPSDIRGAALPIEMNPAVAQVGPTSSSGATVSPAGPVGTLREFKDAAERAYLVQKLRENSWNISKTAEVIDTPRSNLYKKLEQYGIKQEVDG